MGADDWPIVFGQVTVSFFVDRGHDGFGNGNSPVFRYWLKIAVRAGVSLVTSYLSIVHGISSGPSAFLGLIPLRSFVTPCAVSSRLAIVR